jgi:putative DNA primase/helicase
MRLAKDTAAGLYRDAAGLATRDLRKQVADWAAKTESEPRLRAMLSLAQSELAIRPEQFDADRWALNCMNGTLDLQAEAVLHPHRRAQLITRMVPTIYDRSAECPIWESVLATLFQGDEGLIKFVQKSVGYSLTGDTREQVVFIFHGTGANGKTLVLMVLMDLLGDYATQTPAATLLVKKGDGIPNDIARLAGCRFAAAVETEDGQRLAEGLVKQMTGRDRLVARFLRAEFFEFVPQFKLFLATNHKPRIRGTDHAIWRRIRLVPFAVTIPDAQQDRDLPEKLKAEWPGILAWAVRGCLAWQREGLGTPDAVAQWTQRYREEMDVLGAFIAERCRVEPTLGSRASALYEAYTAWSQRAGERPLSKRSFGLRLGERGFQAEKVNGDRWWIGLEIAAEGTQT